MQTNSNSSSTTGNILKLLKQLDGSIALYFSTTKQ